MIKWVKYEVHYNTHTLESKKKQRNGASDRQPWLNRGRKIKWREITERQRFLFNGVEEMLPLFVRKGMILIFYL